MEYLEEVWKTVKETDTRRWEVSSIGRRRITCLKINKIIKLDYGVLNDRYMVFSGIGLIHRLVAQAFIPNTENKLQVNHIDGNKLNNHISNLEWCTASENIQHAYDTNLKVMKNKTNEKIKKALTGRKLSVETIEKIRLSHKFPVVYTFINDKDFIETCTKRELISKYDLERHALSSVCNGTRLEHRGWRLLI